jgi:hypothetical protein
MLTARRAIGDMIETEITVTATDASGNTGRASINVLIAKSLHRSGADGAELLAAKLSLVNWLASAIQL